MSFGISQEQRAFADAVGHVLQRFDKSLDPADSDDVQRERLWQELDEHLALMSIVVPEQYGGAGGSWRDISVAVEKLAARPAVGGLPGVFAGLAALLAAGGDRAKQIVAEVAAGECIVVPTWLFSDRTWVRTGTGQLVPSGTVDEQMFDESDPGEVLLAAPTATGVRALLPVRTGERVELWLSDPIDQTAGDRLQTVDPGTAVVRIPDQPITAEPVHSGDPSLPVARARATANALVAVEAVGSSAALLERTIDYLKIREQFGQILASFQGLQFMAADLYRAIEPLRSLAYAAVDALDADDLDEIVERSLAAKIVADELHPAASLEAIQMHGGIGFSWELGLHRHFKRAVVNRATGGDDAASRRLLADRIRRRATTLTKRRGSTDTDDELRLEVREWIARNRQDAPKALAALEPMLYEHTAAEHRWIERLREGRWLCLSWPEEYGGRGLSALQCIAVNEEFAAAGVPRLSMGLGETLLAPALLAHGTEEQKARLLPRILSGEDVYCQGFSEPGHGSDLAHIQTRGEVTDSGIVVNGSKIWQSGAHIANRIFLLCRTDAAAAPHAGLTYCIADLKDNGITIEPIRMMPGFYGYNQTIFENAHVALDDVIGGLNNGWKVAITTLGSERAGEITSQYLGYLRELEHLIDELSECGRLDAAELDLVPMWIEILKMKLNGLRVVEEMRHGGSPDGLLSIDKLNWSEYHVRFGLEAARMMGMHGLVRPAGDDAELPHLQRVMLESPGRRISRGTNQIQRRIIAQRILGMPR